jgi:hypothetical protein
MVLRHHQKEVWDLLNVLSPKDHGTKLQDHLETFKP